MTIEKWDHVLIDGKWPGVVVQDGGLQSLVETDAPSESGASREQDWYDNDRLDVVRRRRERAVGNEPDDVELY